MKIPRVYTHMYTSNQVDVVVEQLYVALSLSPTMTFTGPLGAGKTTLVQALLRRCGIEGAIQSPTFNYVNIYVNAHQETFYHFDLYRITSLEEFIALGLHDYLYVPSSYALIEWPAVIDRLLHQQKVCQVAVQYVDEAHRQLSYVIDGYSAN